MNARPPGSESMAIPPLAKRKHKKDDSQDLAPLSIYLLKNILNTNFIQDHLKGQNAQKREHNQVT